MMAVRVMPSAATDWFRYGQFATPSFRSSRSPMPGAQSQLRKQQLQLRPANVRQHSLILPEDRIGQRAL